MTKRTFESMDDLTQIIDDLEAAEAKLGRIRALCDECDQWHDEYTGETLGVGKLRAILDG